MEKEALSRSAVEAKYDSMSGVGVLKRWWDPLELECGNIEGRGGELFSRFVRYDVGDGTKIRF
jgi:hypothetical protein